jgi:hypothetical protein
MAGSLLEVNPHFHRLNYWVAMISWNCIRQFAHVQQQMPPSIRGTRS